MRTRLLLSIFLLPTLLFSQVENGFENLPGVTFNAFGGACEYYDYNTTTQHTLANYNAPCGIIYVSETGSATTLGYSIVLDPTTPNGPMGFSDGDYFGVATTASIVSEIGAPPAEGTQAFFMDDVDGTVTMSFDIIDLSGTVNPQFSLQYFLEETSWNVQDLFKVTIQFSDCGSSDITLIDTTTGAGDIDFLNIEGSWNTLSADLSGYTTCKAQLIIDFSSNSGVEQLALDAISFSAGMTLNTETFSLDTDLSIYPNPSKGNITIKNNGISLESVAITDINGRIIKSIDLNGITTNTTLEMSDELSSGLYFVSIVSESTTITKKLIIE